MNSLERPLELARSRVHRHNAIREEIVAFAMAAVIVRSGAPHGHVNDSTSFINGGGVRPHIVSSPVLPTITFPLVVAGLARPGDSVKFPQLFPGPHIISAGIARQTAGDLILWVGIRLSRSKDIHSHDQNVLENC